MITSASLCTQVWSDAAVGTLALVGGGTLNAAALAAIFGMPPGTSNHLLPRDRLLVWFPFGYVVLLFEAFVASVVSVPLALPILVGAAVPFALRRGAGLPHPTLVWAALLCAALGYELDLLPICRGDACFLGTVMFDHSKASVIDAVVREGFPMRNPFANYPGHPSLFYYYGLMYVAAAAIAGPLGLSGWGMDAALGVVTTFAALCLLAAVALVLSQGRRMAAPLVAAVAGFPQASAAVETMLGHYGALGLPRDQALQMPADHFAWVPQHVLATVAALTLLFVYAPVLSGTRQATWPAVTYAAVALAVAGGSSVYVTLVLMVALVLWNLPQLRSSATVVAPHLPLFAAVGLPVAYLMYGVHAPSMSMPFPFAFRLNIPLDGLRVTSWGTAAEAVVLYWLYQVPLQMGMLLLAGGMGLWRLRSTEADSWRWLTIILVGLGLVTYQCIASVLAQNDFGWRAILPGELLLVSWGAAWLSRLFAHREGHDRPLGVVLGLVVALSVATRDPGIGEAIKLRDTDADREAVVLRQSADCWAAVAALVPPTGLVQDNPQGLAHISLVPAGIGLPLMADRKAAFMAVKLVDSYGLNLPADLRATMATRLAAVFDSPAPRTADLLWMRDTLAVRGAVVLRTDPAWNSRAWRQEDVYRQVFQNSGCAAYVAP